MKKYVTLLAISMMLSVGSTEAEAKTTPERTTVEAKDTHTVQRKKRHRNRQRRGFMWGLFKKKSPCGCPNH
jgi:hypothetical protein